MKLISQIKRHGIGLRGQGYRRPCRYHSRNNAGLRHIQTNTGGLKTFGNFCKIRSRFKTFCNSGGIIKMTRIQCFKCGNNTLDRRTIQPLYSIRKHLKAGYLVSTLGSHRQFLYGNQIFNCANNFRVFNCRQ